MILEHLYSGDAWFSAGFVLLVTVVADFVLPPDRHLLLRRMLRIVYIVALPVGLLAGVPLPLLAAAIVILLWTIYLLVGFHLSRRVGGRLMAGMLVVAVVAAMVAEGSWRLRRHPPVAPIGHVVVMGDSLSSGDFGEERTWVDRVGEQLGLSTTNLSRPSSTTGSALRSQLPAMHPCSGCGVVIELGGNDMLDEGSPARMEANLLELVDGARARGAAAVWLVELPIPPGRWAWAAAQRRAIERSGAAVIPRSVLASVLSNEAATSDGLHPTDLGHALLAEQIAAYLSPRPVDGSGETAGCLTPRQRSSSARAV